MITEVVKPKLVLANDTLVKTHELIVTVNGIAKKIVGYFVRVPVNLIEYVPDSA